MITKSCSKCGKEKELAAFYKHKSMADGHLNECKECTRSRVTSRRKENIEAVRAYDRKRGKVRHRIKNAAEQVRRWRSEDSRRTAAHNAVARAIKAGRLLPQPCCRCGAGKAYAHHESYDHKLDVVWLCQPCHKVRHKEMVLLGLFP